MQGIEHFQPVSERSPETEADHLNAVLEEITVGKRGIGALFEMGLKPPDGRLGAPMVEGFEMVSRLGAGASSEVWLAEELESGRMVALKILCCHGRSGETPEYLEREVKMLARLIHPNLVILHRTIIAVDGRPGLVMEWIDGLPLDEWLETHPNLSLEEKLQLFGKIVHGVAFLHDHGVIHRDLKPANIIVNTQGEVKIVDFGLARLHQETQSAVSDGGSIGVSGTLHFMAPEQAANGKGSRAMPVDVYALGVLFYRILTGVWLRPPQSTASETLALVLDPPPLDLPGVSSQLPADVRWVLRQSLASDPARRYCHARDFEADLGRLAAKQPVSARKHTLIYLTTTFLRRQSRRSAVAAALVLAGLITGGAIFTENRRVAARNEENLRTAYSLTTQTLQQLRDELRMFARNGKPELPMTLFELNHTASDPKLPVDAAGELDLRYYQALLAELRSANSESHGSYAPALASIQKALDAYCTLAKEAPDDPSRLRDATLARHGFARLLSRAGQWATAANETRKVQLQIDQLTVWPGFDAASLTPVRCDGLRILAEAAARNGRPEEAVAASGKMMDACAALPGGLLVRQENEAMPRLAVAASDLANHAISAGGDFAKAVMPRIDQSISTCRAALGHEPGNPTLTLGLAVCLHARARLMDAIEDPLSFFREATILTTSLPATSNPDALPQVWTLSNTLTHWTDTHLTQRDPAVIAEALRLSHILTTHLRTQGDDRDEVMIQRGHLYLLECRNALRSGNRDYAATTVAMALTLLRSRQIRYPERPELAFLTIQALAEGQALADLAETGWTQKLTKHYAELLPKVRAWKDNLTPQQQADLALLK